VVKSLSGDGGEPHALQSRIGSFEVDCFLF
jgi:hypothetical protein